MKLLNSSIALLLLSLATFSSVSEAKLAPTTFVGKSKARFPNEASLSEVLGEPEQKQSHAHPKSKSKSLSALSSLTRLAGGSAESVSPAFTYYMDIFWTGLTVVFMAVWLMSMQKFNNSSYENVKFPFFNKQVLIDGFCLAQEKSETLFGLGTLKLCGIVDLLLVTFSYFKYKDSFDVEGSNNKLIYFASAAYTLFHGSIHGFEVDQTGRLVSDENGLVMNIVGVVVLALITAITPIGIKGNFDQAEKPGGLATGIAVWLGLVAFYAIGIQEKVFALTFINVTIFLSIFGSRALVFDKDDEKRLDYYQGKTIMATILAATANIVVMCFEPLVCKNWFASVGGHIWFDVTLWMLMMSLMK